MKIVLDTNIWVSGFLLRNSNAGKIISEWERSKIEVVTSNYIIEEINRVLNYKKIKKHLNWDQAKVDHYLNMIKFFTHIVETDHIIVEVKSDPADAPILATFIASRAQYLVTGDSDLLALSQQYPILSLSEFCEKFFMFHE